MERTVTGLQSSALTRRRGARSRDGAEVRPAAPGERRANGDPREAEAADVHGSALLVRRLDEIDDAIERVCRRAGWFAADAEDFRSWVLMRLLERDCEVLRSFQGRSTLRTYVTVVVSNLMRDFRNHRFGKWRPSAEATRLGGLAVELDRLVNRDGLPVSDAVRWVSHRDDCALSEPELRRLAGRIPARPRRRFVDVERVPHVREDATADGALWSEERRRESRHVLDELERCLETLDAEDQVILRLKYWSGLSVADVARALGLPQKPLYGRIRKCLCRLSEVLRERGVDAGRVRALVGAGPD